MTDPRQSPGSTLIHLLDVGRQMKVRQALMPDAVREAVSAAQVALTNDGRLAPEAFRDRPWQKETTWDVPGALAAGQLNRRQRLAQPGAVVRLDAYVATPPSGVPCVIALTRQTSGSGETPFAWVTIEPGDSYGGSIVPDGPVSAGMWLGIDIDATGSAAGLSVTATVQVS